MATGLRLGCGAFVALLWLARSAHGLGLLADDRFVSRTVTPGCCDSYYEPASFFAPFSAPYQNSSIAIDADGLGLDGTASGWASGFHDDEGNFHGGESVFSIGFRIDGAGTIAMDGCFDSSQDAVPGSGTVRLLARDQQLFAKERYAYQPCEFDPFAFSAELDPGAYTLEIRAAASGTDSGVRYELAFDVRDTVHPIPEASTFSTLAAGLAWLGRRRHALRGRRRA